MRIAYVANHGCGGNDDEGAVAHAFRELGHTVSCVHERGWVKPASCDFLLFHKWDDVGALESMRGVCPRAFWYFDLVDFPDPTLSRRCNTRKAWMERVMPHVEFGFCTDGDWAEENDDGRLHWLPQGADGRIAGAARIRDRDIHVLFTGTADGGAGRRSFVDELRDVYGGRFKHIQRGAYRESLREYTARARVVVCPDAPVKASYWSNRVYNAAGFGGIVLHPRCSRIQEQYSDEELLYYDDREQMHGIIRDRIGRLWRHSATADAALAKTLAQHLYVHRCEEMLRRL